MGHERWMLIMKTSFRSLVAALAAAVSFTGFGGTTYYVSPTGDGTAPTAGFATGYSSIQAAIDAASAGDAVLLDKTTFSVRTEIQVNKAITLGGVGENWETVLDGENANNNILKISVPGATVHSLTYTRCGIKWANKLGLEMTADSMVSNVVARENGNAMADNTQGRYVMNVSAGFVTHCCITNNNAPNNAGIKLSVSSKMENCYIADNVDRGYSGTSFYGIVVVEGSATVCNCTIINNKSNYSAFYYGSSSAKVYNNIIWGNTTKTEPSVTANWKFNQTGWLKTNWKCNCLSPADGFPAGNFDADPGFEADRLHIPSTSPCYGKADASVAPKTDIELNARGEFPCIGCSEYVPKSVLTCTVKSSADTSVLPEEIVLTAEIGGSPSGEVSYAWDLNGDGVVDSTDPEVRLSRQGRYLVSLTVMDEAGTPARSSYDKKIFIYDAGAEGLKFYVSPTGDGTDPTKGFATAYPTLKLAFADEDLGDGSMLILDRARFDLSVDNNAREISTDVDITKRITVTGVGKPDESILDGGREYDGRRWGSPRHYPSFNFKASGIVFRNMTFERMGSDAGQAIYIPNGTYTDCVISNMIFRNTGWGYENWGNAFKAHVMTGNQNTHVSCCVFTNNVFPCAVLYMTGNQNALLENCYFANNICTGAKYDYGVVSLDFGAPGGLGWFRNNTVVNNRSKKGAVQQDGYGNVSVLNNIVYGNTDLDGVEPKNYCGTGYRDLWKSCCIGEGPDTFTDASNIFLDPGLTDDGIHLKASSPCIGKANPAYAPLTDIEGAERSSQPCIGCSEYLGSGVFSCSIVPPASYIINEPDRLVLEAEVGSAAVKPLTYAWDLDGDGSPDSSDAQPVLTEIGRYAVSLTVTDALGHDAKAFLRDQIIIYPPERTIPSENVFFVTAENNPGAQPPYSTWETAANTLREAYELAKSVAGATIILGDGTHEVDSTGGSMLISNGVSVVSLHGHVFTTLNYSGRDKNMFTINDPEALIEGFTVTHSKNNPYANGLVAVLNSGVLRDVVISGIENKGFGIVRVITTTGRPALIERCAFVGNSANGNSGPIALSVAGAGCCTVENTLFAHNSSAYACSGYGALGSALNSSSSALEVRNCTFVDNDSMSGLPLHFTATPAVFENNVVVGGTTNNGAFVANDLILKDPSNVDKGVLSSVRRSCVFPASADYSGHEKVLTVDPLFVDRAGLDFHLQDGSPCVNAGDKSSVAADAKDFDGKPRIVRGLVDLGCYENQRAYGLQILVR